MSGLITASIGGALISGIAANSAADTMASSADSELAFAQQQYDDWQAIYGPVQQNLSDYYTNLNADQYAAQGVQYAEEEYTKASEQLNQSLSQRGLMDSGISASIERENSFGLAETKADIRQGADEAVANQQLSFLSVGQGSDPSSALLNTLSDQAAYDAQVSANANSSFSSALGGAVEVGIEGLYDAYGDSDDDAPDTGLDGGTT